MLSPSLENFNSDIWFEIISHLRKGVSSVCKKLEGVNRISKIAVLLLEANTYHLYSITHPVLLNEDVIKNVKYLTLKEFHTQSFDQLQIKISVIKTCVNCDTLDLSDSDIIDANLQTLVGECPTIKNFHLKGCKDITNTGLNALISKSLIIQSKPLHLQVAGSSSYNHEYGDDHLYL